VDDDGLVVVLGAAADGDVVVGGHVGDEAGARDGAVLAVEAVGVAVVDADGGARGGAHGRDDGRALGGVGVGGVRDDAGLVGDAVGDALRDAQHGVHQE